MQSYRLTAFQSHVLKVDISNQAMNHYLPVIIGIYRNNSCPILLISNTHKLMSFIHSYKYLIIFFFILNLCLKNDVSVF